MKSIKILVVLGIILTLFLTGCNITSGIIVNPDDQCTSLEGAAKDNCYFERYQCDKLQNLKIRNSCIAELAKLKKDIVICGLIIDEQAKGYCQEQLAEINNDPQICEQITYPYWRDTCYYNLALNDDDAEICLEIGNDEQRIDCRYKIALEKNDAHLCTLLPENKADYCLFSVAAATVDAVVCDNISTGLQRDTCRFKIAKITVNKKDCEIIKINEIRTLCHERMEELAAEN